MSTISAISPRSSIPVSFRSSWKWRGTCRSTSRNPMTPCWLSRCTSSTPCSANRDPPTAASESSGLMRRSAAATPAACRSPEASPATNRTLRMRSDEARERRQSPFDFPNDAECDAEYEPSVFTGHDNGSRTAQGGNKTLELELEWLAFRCVERNAIDESRDVYRRGPYRRGIDIRLQSKEIARPCGEIERQIPTLLKDADLSLPLARDTARRDVGNGA